MAVGHEHRFEPYVLILFRTVRGIARAWVRGRHVLIPAGTTVTVRPQCLCGEQGYEVTA